MTAAEKIQLFSALAPVIATVGVAAMLGWVATTWMRIRNGYPLDGQWGQALYPKRDDETIERVKLLTTENGQLRAELGAIKDRLQNVERIVTDSGHMVAQEIEQLRNRAN
jgi:predicted metal-binding membrane protein